MARVRRLPSARSGIASNNTQAKNCAETRDRHEKPQIEKDDNSHATAPSAGDETKKNDEHQQSVSSQVGDNRTFQRLVHDYGDDSKWHTLFNSLVRA